MYSIRKDKMIRHILRLESFIMTIIEGDVKRHIERGRPRAEYMTQIMKDIYKGKF